MAIRNIRKEDIERIEVEYIKGKYQYKKSYGTISGKRHKILFSGPVVDLQPALENIRSLVRTPENRISTESRRKLKVLEEKASNLNNFKDQGITHIIIYKCLEI